MKDNQLFKLKAGQPLVLEVQRLKSLGYKIKEIAKKLNMSMSQCSYILYRDKAKRKEYTDKRKEKAKLDPHYILRMKIARFKRHKGRYPSPDYFCEDVLKKFHDNTCYLTGQKIDLNDGESYHLDHIIPSSKGGSNELDNMQLCCKYANVAKSDLDVPSLLDLCKQIISHSQVR